MLRRFGKGIAILFGFMVLFVVTLFIAMSLFNSPTYAWRILRYGQSDIGDSRIFPERPIQNGTNYSPIERGHQGTPSEVEYLYKDESRKEVLEGLLRRTGTRAFLILKTGRVQLVLWQAPNIGEQLPRPGNGFLFVVITE